MIGAQIEGIAGVQNFLLSIQEGLANEQILDEVGALLLNRNRTRFLAETDPDGVPWIPSRAGELRRAFGGTGTLFDTGRLFHSIQLVNLGPGHRAIQTDVPYAKKHQEGEDGMVKRVFLGFSDDDISVVEQLVVQRLQQLFSGEGQ